MVKNVFGGNIKGFTLVELLVVVLIVAILAAIALPQYQKAVEKSKAIQGIAFLKGLQEAQILYFLEHGTYAKTFSQLDMTFGLMGKEKGYSFSAVTDTLSNADWSLQLERPFYLNVWVTRLTGKYAGAGFFMRGIYPKSEPALSKIHEHIACFERKSAGVLFKGNPGDYCQKMFQGTLIYEDRYHRIYRM